MKACEARGLPGESGLMDEFIKKITEKGYLITPEALEIIRRHSDFDELMTKILSSDSTIITPEILEEKKEKVKEIIEVKVERTDFRPIAKEIETKIIVKEKELPKAKGKVEDFVEFFRSRYEKIKAILEQRGNSITSVEKAKQGDRETRICVIVNDKRTTKNKHIIVEAEDLSDQITILFPASNKNLIEKAIRLMPDEVIAVDGRYRNRLFIANNLIQPDVKKQEIKKTEEDIAIVLSSDIHVGNKLFLKESFEKFIAWLNGKRGDEKQKRLAEKVAYISLAGDLVDGIGIYPGQEEELEEEDIFKQYEMLEDYLLQIPEHIKVLVAPGNHDAVKTADPQQKLPKELVPRLYEYDNFYLIGSPGRAEVHGLKFLVYHGTSFIDFINHVPGCSFERGSEMMVEMLKRRHVHPFYGGKPITPEKEDIMVIEEEPDVFHCGETHNTNTTTYKGVIAVNSGTWQQITPYQIKQGHKATPGVLPILMAKEGKISIMRF